MPLLSSFSVLGSRRDPRWDQIVYLGAFLLYGMLVLTWGEDWRRIAVTILAALGTQAMAVLYLKLSWHSLKSAAITGLGMSLLLRSDDLNITALAVVMAIGSKFLIRFKGKHIFNPGNLGIVMAVFLFGEAWVSPGQWGHDLVFLGLAFIAGINVLLRVGRMDTGAWFLISYAAAQFIYAQLWLGWPADHFAHVMSNGTLVIFAFFMITDPMTTPNAPKARLIWAVSVGLLAFGLTRWEHLHTAPILALFLAAPFTVLLDHWLRGNRFEWKPTSLKFIAQFRKHEEIGGTVAPGTQQ